MKMTREYIVSKRFITDSNWSIPFSLDNSNSEFVRSAGKRVGRGNP